MRDQHQTVRGVPADVVGLGAMTATSERGNFVSEWFGYRTFPQVHGGTGALRTQVAGQCPFLTAATHEKRECVKSTSSSGVCTINNASNGVRQDWLVCPYRALDADLIEHVVRRLFGAARDQPMLVVPAPAAADQAMRARIVSGADDGALAVVYFQNKLGGEISVRATDRSPELSFDMTLVELANADPGRVRVGRFGVLELQTMDFHGSYRRAVQNLNDALRLHGSAFADVLQKNQRWLGERIEGPNIANVFKRTFYQMMLKFQLGVHPRSVGTALAIPQAVWDSWQPHLGRPDLIEKTDGTHALQRPEAHHADTRAWIYVFDIEEDADRHPSPIVVKRVIETNAASMAYYALEEVPTRAFSEAESAAAVVAAIHRRLAGWWPELEAFLTIT